MGIHQLRAFFHDHAVRHILPVNQHHKIQNHNKCIRKRSGQNLPRQLFAGQCVLLSGHHLCLHRVLYHLALLLSQACACRQDFRKRTVQSGLQITEVLFLQGRSLRDQQMQPDRPGLLLHQQDQAVIGILRRCRRRLQILRLQPGNSFHSFLFPVNRVEAPDPQSGFIHHIDLRHRVYGFRLRCRIRTVPGSPRRGHHQQRHGKQQDADQDQGCPVFFRPHLAAKCECENFLHIPPFFSLHDLTLPFFGFCSAIPIMSFHVSRFPLYMIRLRYIFAQNLTSQRRTAA